MSSDASELERLRQENEALKTQLSSAQDPVALLSRVIAEQDSTHGSNSNVVELRSDTLTKPTPAMRMTMALAEVGDAIWGTDPTVKRLEAFVADLCGKESALFVPSGVMGNLVCVMCHCDSRVSEVILGNKAHQLLYETGNLSCVGNIQTRSVPTNDDGTIPLEELANSFRGVDQHWPTTRAVLLENTHNFKGGKVLPLDYIKEVKQLCASHRYPVALHCDGARAWHAAIALNVSMKTLLEHFDTASLCLSKGLGAPIGSVIVGPRELIEGKARRLVKMLGGGMRQSGIIAAAGLYAVQNHFERLAEDHRSATQLFEALTARGIAAIQPQTNILIWHCPKDSASRIIEYCANRGVMIGSIGPALLRAIPHLNCGLSDVDGVAKVIVEAHAAV